MNALRDLMKDDNKAAIIIVFAVIICSLPFAWLMAEPTAAQAQAPPALFSSTEPEDVEKLRAKIEIQRGVFTLDLIVDVFSVDEADNIRWSLMRRLPEYTNFMKNGVVQWPELRNASASGTITLPKGTWSFNSVFRGAPGYKKVSGVLARGQCSLASGFLMVAKSAGVAVDFDEQHDIQIPGFTAENSVNIWWGTGSKDLRIESGGADLMIQWNLTPAALELKMVSAPAPKRATKQEQVLVSYYNPALGGPNCGHWNAATKTCTSNTASGEPWLPLMNRGAACPKQWPFGTVVYLPDHDLEVVCKDRGSRISYADQGIGITWIDLLRTSPVQMYGTTTLANITYPEDQ